MVASWRRLERVKERKITCLSENHGIHTEADAGDGAHDSFKLAGWSGHDVKVKSKWLYHYFEHDCDGDMIHLNIGY